VYSTDDWSEIHRTPCRIPGDQTGHGAASPDGKLAAFEYHTDNLKLVTLPAGIHLLSLNAPECSDIRHVAFSRDSRKVFILTSRHRLYAWDLEKLNSELAKIGLAWNE
jgi:hypothetical protein